MEEIYRKMPVCENCIHLIMSDKEVKCTYHKRDTGLLQQCKDGYKNAYGLDPEK